MTRRALIALTASLAALALTPPLLAQDKSITVASTTSTEQSGLFGHILPIFDEEDRHRGQGRRARHRARRSTSAGAAMPTSCSCTTARPRTSSSPKAHGVKRRDVMYNDFVLVGPKSRSREGRRRQGHRRRAAARSRTRRRRSCRAATRAARTPRSCATWKEAGVDLAEGKGAWYRETGSGMGPALNTASSMNAYILADRGTWLAFKNRGDLGDPRRGRQAALQSSTA